MAGVITLSSSSDDDEDVKFICEQRTVPNRGRPIKEENTIKLENGHSRSKNVDVIRRLNPTQLSSSVTLTKINSESTPNRLPVNQVASATARNGCKLVEESDDEDADIICLSSSADTKTAHANLNNNLSKVKSKEVASANGVVPKNEPICISLDNDVEIIEEENKKNGIRERKSSGSCLDSIILIDSDDEVEGKRLPLNVVSENDDSRDIPQLDQEDLEEICLIEDSDQERGSSNDDNSDNGDSTSSDEGSQEEPPEKTKTDHPSKQVDTKPSASQSAPTPPAEVDDDLVSPDGPGNYTEKLLKQLMTKIGLVGFDEKNLSTVKRKIMKYYNSASEDFTQSQKFVDQLKDTISEISRLMKLPNSKEFSVLSSISDKIKEFLTIFQRGSSTLTPHLQKLYRMWERLKRRIAKLEKEEVDSDPEYENPYVMLDSYRKRAVKVYNKICELEGKANHADRLYQQDFIYSGVGPVPVQRALERFYNKTKEFPDFSDVYKLVKKANVDSDLGLTPSQAHLTAQQVFIDFGKKLKKRREWDDHLVLVTYLPDGLKDPADYDTSLKEKLQINRTMEKTEEDVLAEFSLKEAAASDERKAAEKEGKDSSKASDSESGDDNSDSDDKTQNMFMDSDEEMAYFEHVERRRRPSQDEPPSKKLKTSEDQNEKDSTSKNDLEGPSTSKTDREGARESETKDSFMGNCNLISLAKVGQGSKV